MPNAYQLKRFVKDAKAQWIAFVVSLVLHLMLLYFALTTSEPLENQSLDMRIEFEQIPYVEANPTVQQTKPDQKLFQAARDQKAAQPILKKADKSPLPSNLEGQRSAHKVLQGTPERQTQLLRASVLEVQKQPKVLKEKLPQTESKASNLTDYIEKSKRTSSSASAGSKVSGPLILNMHSTGKVGMVAVDASFSEFGRYQERMLELIVARWHFLSKQSSLTSLDVASFVHVCYKLHSDGHISDIKVLKKTATDTGVERCIEAIRSQSPFNPWTQQMQTILADPQIFYINFLYR